MIIYVLLNIAVVLAIVGFDLYRQQYKQLKFSSLLLAIVINTTINMFIIQKYNFISTYTTALLIIWLLPFWYIFLGIYVLFIAFIIWQKVFQHY